MPNYWAKRRSNLKYRYNITPEQVGEMLSAQNNTCPICLLPLADPYVDHCHSTRKVRNLLCNSCNSGLGHFGDNVDRLRRAIHYVQHHARTVLTAPRVDTVWIVGAA